MEAYGGAGPLNELAWLCISDGLVVCRVSAVPMKRPFQFLDFNPIVDL
uniref:Uncharacterized protein n=1 Tax=Anguilla anguilla TaxID=7936 RepID=A0A0E9TKX7_ANGAN